jgi:hypothetical protein
MLKLVIELNVAVMELSKAQRDEAKTPTTGYVPPAPRTRPPPASRAPRSSRTPKR